MSSKTRGPWLTAVVSVLIVALVVIGGLVTTRSALPAVALAPAGHWVVNTASGSALHVDAGTGSVSSRVELPAGTPEVQMALQGPERGYLVSEGSVTVFGRSTLTVESIELLPAGGQEVPVGIETIGGPYLVYRQAGTVIRLAVPPVSILAGGPLRRPTAADDGTVWVHRDDSGDVCRIAAAANDLDCVANFPTDRPGDLTTVGSDAALVDLGADTLTFVSEDGPGQLRPLGVDLPADALVSDHSTSAGLLPVLDPGWSELVLVPVGESAGAALRTPLPPGRWTAPLAAGSITVLLDTATGTVMSVDAAGREVARKELGAPPADTGLVRGGDGNVYLDGADGAQTVVVTRDTGDITAVDTAPGADAPALAEADPTPPLEQVPAPDPVPEPVPVPVPPPLDLPALPDAPPNDDETVLAGQAPTVPGTALDGGAADGGEVDGEPADPPPGPAAQEQAAPEVPVQNVPVQEVPAGAPPNLVVALGDLRAVDDVDAVLQWQQPVLGSGQLVRYEVLLDGAVEVGTGATRATVALSDACAPVELSVRAVTTGQSGATQTGPVSTDSFTPRDRNFCLPEQPQVAAQAGAGKAIVVTGLGGQGECSVRLDGDVVETVDCTAGQVTVEAPEYATTYAVSVAVTNGYGTSTGSAGQVTTGPDPTPPAQPVQDIPYRISARGGEAYQIEPAGSVSQPFRNTADVITTIGVIVGIDPETSTQASHQIRIQLLKGGQAVGGGSAEVQTDVETRIGIGDVAAVPGDTYTLRVTNLAAEVVGVYLNAKGNDSSSGVPNVASNLGGAQVVGDTTRGDFTAGDPLSGIVIGQVLR